MVLQNGATATGSGDAINVAPFVTVGVQVVITMIASVIFEGTIDGSNWLAVQATNVSAGTTATSASASGLFRINVAGLARLRARVSSYTSGTVTVTAQA